MYKMPTTEMTPANISVWAQFGIFSLMGLEGILDFDDFSILSDADPAWFLISVIVALSLLFKVPYHREIATFLIPVGMGLVEQEAFYIIGILFFAPIAYLPSMAFDELGQNTPFGVWNKKGWGIVFFGIFLLFFGVFEGSLAAVAMDGDLMEDGDLTEEYGIELQADCEASADCSFLDTDEADRVETLWDATPMERNIAYIGLGMMVISILAIIAYSANLVDMEMVTPMNAGIIFVGSFWVEEYLWGSIMEAGWSGEYLFLIPISGLTLMAIHGLFSKAPETSA
jgi:hypothetical protein